MTSLPAPQPERTRGGSLCPLLTHAVPDATGRLILVNAVHGRLLDTGFWQTLFMSKCRTTRRCVCHVGPVQRDWAWAKGYLSPFRVLKVLDGRAPQGTENSPEARAALAGPLRVQTRQLHEGPQAQAAAVQVRDLRQTTEH